MDGDIYARKESCFVHLMKQLAMNTSNEATSIEELGKTAFTWWYEEVRWIFRVIVSAVERFYWDNGFSRAASLAYTSLLSTVPSFALCFGIFASFEQFKKYVSHIEKTLIIKFVPNHDVAMEVSNFLMERTADISGVSVPMLAFFVITVLLLINAIEGAFNETWQVFEPRPWSSRIGIFCAIILIAPLVILSLYVFVVLQLDQWNEGARNGFLDIMYKHLLPFFMVFSALAVLNYLVPKAPVRFKSAIFGAFFTALVFSCAYAGFAVYLEHASYNKLYGAVAAIPIFLVWLYVFWTIVMLGVEATYQAQYLPRSGQAWKRSVHSVGDARMLLATQALVMVTKAFLDGKEMPSDIEVAEKLGCSTVVLKPIIDVLEKARLLARGSSPEQPLTLLRTPSQITVAEVNDVLFKGRQSMRYPGEVAKVFLEFGSGTPAKPISLADLVQLEEESPPIS